MQPNNKRKKRNKFIKIEKSLLGFFNKLLLSLYLLVVAE